MSYSAIPYLLELAIQRIATYAIDKIISKTVDSYTEEDPIVQEYRNLPRVVSVETHIDKDEDWIIF